MQTLLSAIMTPIGLSVVLSILMAFSPTRMLTRNLQVFPPLHHSNGLFSSLGHVANEQLCLAKGLSRCVANLLKQPHL